jgi:hypothetical protein
MELNALIGHFRLAAETETRGLRCDLDGLSLAGVALLRKTAEGFASRRDDEVGALLLAAYGEVFDTQRLTRALSATAAALNRGDLALATIAAVHLRLPTLGKAEASRIAAVEDFLRKYNPDQPRDWHGRWTTEGDGPDGSSAAPTEGRSHWDGVSRPSGGRLIQTDGDTSDDYENNEPPPWEGRVEPEPPPSTNIPEVPEGWDQIEDGAFVRRPTLRNGQPWPEADATAVRRILARGPPGAPPPTMWVYVPLDGKGPDLIGSDENGDFEQPPATAR